MMRIMTVALLLAVSGCTGDTDHMMDQQTRSEYVFNRAPLAPNRYAELPLGSVRAEGWLQEQLRRMAEGMTGHLDEWYPTVGASNGWLGGDGDVWERGPYWLDGLVPLAYLLGDERLIAKAQPYIEWTLASQDSTGYFGPAPEAPGTENRSQEQRTNAADWWPRMVVLKVLQQHYEATRDERVIDLMTRYFRYENAELDKTPLGHWTGWASARGGENESSVLWLYNRTGDAFLLDLAQILFNQTLDWTADFESGMANEDYWLTHVVNVAMAVKQPAVQYVLTGDPHYLDAVRAGLYALMEKHGLPTGIFTGDELLHGTDPVHGTELCAIVEFMFSLENLMMLNGDVDFIDRLERVAYNALPTQVTDDQTARQYFQQVNQIDLTNGDLGLFHDAYSDAICYGLLTGYPCCTTNLHQGWPKFTQHVWLASADGGLAMLTYAPASVTATVRGGKEVTLRAATNYPMEDVVRIEVVSADNAAFPLHLRIPTWSPEATVSVNGEPVETDGAGTILVIERTWRTGDVVGVNLPADVQLSRWHERAVAVHRGPLLYALPISGLEERVPALQAGLNTDRMREVHPTSDWNFGLVADEKNPAYRVELVTEKTANSEVYPWTVEDAPLRLRVSGVRIPNWTSYNGAAGPMPPSPVYVSGRQVEEMTLIPYGATTLRIAQFPEVRLR